MIYKSYREEYVINHEDGTSVSCQGGNLPSFSYSKHVNWLNMLQRREHVTY